MGRTEKQALGLAKLATQFQNIADAEISAGDAALFINATMKGFGMTTVKEAEHITDAVNET